MATISRGGKSIKKTHDKPIECRLENEVRIYDLGTKTIPEFLSFCATRYNCQSAHINNVGYYLRKGDAQTEQKFEQYRKNHRLRIESARVGDVYSHCGDYVDVGRYMGGEPECMVDYIGDQPASFLTIRLRVAATDGDFLAYYANICDLVDYLENKGTRCRIVAQLNHGNWRDKENPVRALCDVVVKDFSEPFSVGTFCAIFFHIEFSRLIYECAVSISANTDVVGIDSLYNQYGNPNGFEQSPDTSEWIVFPSLWFDDYSERIGRIDPMPFFQQIRLGHLID